MKTAARLINPELEHGVHAYVEAFRQFEKDLVVPGQPWLERERRDAIERFRLRGFPSTKQEEWKYTNVAPLASTRFKTLVGEPAPALKTAAIEPLPGAAAHLVLVNGRFSPELSRLDALPKGVRLGSLAQALRTRGQDLEPFLRSTRDGSTNPFRLLNAAFFEDGALLEVAAGTVLERPIHVLSVASAAGEPHVHHPRNLLILGENSQATVVETYLAADDAVYLSNPTTEVRLGLGAGLEHAKVQHESERAYHTSTLDVRQGRQSRFHDFNASLGGLLVRQDIGVAFEEEGGECSLDGFYHVAGKRHVDNHTQVDHIRPRCTSREFYKGILDDASSGVFYGRVFIRPGAQKTDASQTNKNLVLSDEAYANSTPALEIYNNDVKASHGSSTGQIDRDALFYLRSRGLGDATARSILIYAFARDVLNRAQPAPLRDGLDGFLFTRLPNGQAVREAIA